MEIPAKYDPALTEDKWYKYWMDHKFFKSVPDNRKPYCIVIPPPNVTGVLHMGHMLNNTLQDVLVRRARMQGKNACWVPGTDHASIATEARVVNKLAAEGIKKFDLTRDEFLEHAWEWTHKHGGIILEQLKKLGASCDWDRTCFTMDEARSESVIKVFIDLHKKGYIYRGVRMVNWDPQAKTAVSDEEVNYTEVKSKLYYVKYKIEGESGYVTVATTRPETILGDTAICVNPNDERYKGLRGKKVIVPMVNRVVPVLFDEYVDPEFGTGALKITPAHDLADYEIGLRYNLEVIDIFSEDGTLNEKAQLFVGIDRFVARDLSVEKLQEENLLDKVEDYNNKVGLSERTNAVIEPRLSVQWFLKMKKISEPALENVMNDTIKLHPAKFKNTYKHWMENVKDWCISRQLWWGHRIPAYYLPDGSYVIAETESEALQLAIEKSGNKNLTIADLRQDEDVLDTWFSSWLWPISVFDGIRDPENADIKYYYPTDDLVTAPEILFFWVARMVIAGYEYRGAEPFKNVYLTGIVRDKQRRKMSKSLGNSPEPIELIGRYSADGVRVGMLMSSPAGNDLLYDEALSEQGRNFGNKIWNAFRLVKHWEVDASIPQPEYAKASVLWFDNILNRTIGEIDEMFNSYRISEALMAAYKLFWDEFSAWYLEMVKPEYQKPIDKATYDATVGYFDKLLKILHPFMPFITEEIWHLLEERKSGESVMISKMPVAEKFDENKRGSYTNTKH
jgi:valyl-tRNA synthetase